MLQKEEQRLIDLAVTRLVAKHPENSFTEVSDAVTRARAHFDGKPIRDFVPLLVERRADRELCSHTSDGPAPSPSAAHQLRSEVD